MDLTRESKEVLYALYTEYRHRRSSGVSRSAAASFGSFQSVASFIPEYAPEDVEDCLRELGRAGYVNNRHADNHVIDCRLSTDGISKMEQYPKDVFVSVASFISQFIP